VPLIFSNLLEKIKDRQDLRNVIANTGWLFSERIVRMGVSLFVGVWVARYLGVEQFGLLNYALALTMLFGAIAPLGLPLLVVRSLTNEPENSNAILGTTFFLQLAGAVATVMLSVGCVVLLRGSDPLIISLVAVLASAKIFKAFDSISLWFQSQVQSKYTAIAKSTTFLIVSAIKVILINTNAPLIAFAFAQAAELMIAAVGFIIVYRARGQHLSKWRWNGTLAKRLLKESWPLILSTLTIFIYLKVDQLMLGEMAGSEAVGLYSSAARISEIWYFIPTAISSSLAPAIYTAKKSANQTLYYRKIKKLLSLLFYFSVAITLTLTFLSGKIVVLLFGNEYAAAGSILAIHTWASIFVFSGVGTSSWFVAEKLTNIAFRKNLIGAAVNVALNYFLIPIYGGIGAAIATVISYAMSSLFANALTHQTREIFKLQVKAMLPFA